MNNSYKIIFISIGLLLLLSVGLSLFQPNLGNKIEFTKSNDPKRIVYQVGDEPIYQADFDNEFAQMPKNQQNQALVQSAIKEKLINDSITLSQAKKENLITLDEFIYANTNKNYSSRIKAIENVKKIINERAQRIEGIVISIWFYNSIIPNMGLEKAKSTVREKITNIHKDVKSKSLTPEKAIEQIQNDQSLNDIDEAFKANAGFSFSKVYGQKITLDKEFDEMLWTLEEGEVSEVKALRNTYDPNPPVTEEVLYAFGVIKKKNKSQEKRDYTQWLEESKKDYAVTEY